MIVTRAPVRVAVAQFEDIIARGLRALIDEDESLELVAAGIDYDRLPALFAAEKPEVAIDNFGSLESAADLRKLHRRFPATRLIVLANRPTTGESRQMLAFGATACLSKASEARDVLHAIHLASRGLHVLPSIQQAPAPAAGPDTLTPRESEVMELLQTGKTNAEIANDLHVSVETIRSHARRIYRKLGVKTRRDLLARR
jgi:DNA-binding NarL/FixJ family response regulator